MPDKRYLNFLNSFTKFPGEFNMTSGNKVKNNWIKLMFIL